MTPRNERPEQTEIDIKPAVLDAIARMIADTSEGDLVLFTQHVMIAGKPQSESFIQGALDKAIESLEKGVETRPAFVLPQPEKPLPPFKLKGAGVIELRDATLIPLQAPQAKISLDQLFVFTDEIVGFAGGKTSLDVQGSP